jgi:hypothetical protein
MRSSRHGIVKRISSATARHCSTNRIPGTAGIGRRLQLIRVIGFRGPTQRNTRLDVENRLRQAPGRSDERHNHRQMREELQFHNTITKKSYLKLFTLADLRRFHITPEITGSVKLHRQPLNVECAYRDSNMRFPWQHTHQPQNIATNPSPILQPRTQCEELLSLSHSRSVEFRSK